MVRTIMLNNLLPHLNNFIGHKIDHTNVSTPSRFSLGASRAHLIVDGLNLLIPFRFYIWKDIFRNCLLECTIYSRFVILKYLFIYEYFIDFFF